MDFLYQIIIYPIQLFIEIIYVSLYHVFEHIAGRCGYAIIGVSLAVSFLTLPLYLKAEKLQDIQRDILNKMKKKLESIKRNFTGDKKYMLISAYYRKNSYHPLMALRSSLSLFIMIPFFMAGYIFLSQPQLLSGESFLFLKDLSKQDQLINLLGFKINLLPILMTVINILSGYIYSEKLSKGEKSQLYITAFIFLLLLYSSPSGLVFYWTCNNIFSLCKNIWLKYNLKISLPIKLNIIDNLDLKFNIDIIFILSMILLWLITGFIIPSNFIASSPIEICWICRDITIWKVLSYPALQAFGIFVFWGILIFYLADKKLRNLFTLISVSALCLSLINIYRDFSGTIDLSFKYTAKNSATPVLLSYIYIFLFYAISIFIFYMIFKNIGKKIISSILFILIFACALNIFVNIYEINQGSVRYKEILANEKNNSLIKNKIFKFTKTGKNVLIIFLDKAVNSFFPIILEKNNNLKKSFEGFVYYPNTATFYCHTILGAPPIFGGYEYTPTEMNKRIGLMKDKHNEALLVLPSIFKNKGSYVSFTDAPLRNYEWISDNKIFTDKGINAKNLIGYYTENFLKNKLNIELKDYSPSVFLKHDLLFYSFMTISPDVISNVLYDNGRYLNNISMLKKSEIGYKLRLFDSYSALLELKNLSDFNSKENLTLNIVVNDVTHEPFFLQYPKYTLKKDIDNKGDNFIGSEKTFKHYHVNASALYRVSEWLEVLKKNGVYDNTRIIIVADHGANISTPTHQNPKSSFFNPLLIVKDFNSNGDYKIDNSFMTNADVPYIATKDVINNPVNPFTGKNITKFDKSKGIIVLDDFRENPKYFKEDECIFKETSKISNISDVSKWSK